MLTVVLLPALFLVAAQNESVGSYLYQPSHQFDQVLRAPAVPYLPQPGDIMLATDNNLFWEITHDLALAFEPHNSAIICSRRDGSLAILEAGPNDTFRIRRLDMLPHLREYEAKGPVWIRKRRVPLTVEQSLRLTEFAEAQDGKRFALGRLGIQLTPFRTRGPARTWFMGKPHGGDRSSYFCSELVTEACVVAGLIDPRTARPSATYPHDLFFEKSLNPFLRRHFDLSQGWYPPARWTSVPFLSGSSYGVMPESKTSYAH
jgi:hypothetical protein